MRQPHKIVYLTFDDGIESGTAEVLRVLEAHGVPAAFFLTGLHTWHAWQERAVAVGELLRVIRSRFLLCNHSYSHAHGYYSSYYRQGLLLDNAGRRMGVKDDFMRNRVFLAELLGVDPSGLPAIARLPGRKGTEEDAVMAVRELEAAGYRVIGWNEEWRMHFDFAAAGISRKEALLSSGRMDYANPEHVYPRWDMDSPEHAGKDRLREGWEAVASRILSCPREQVVLLMHERAFRPRGGMDGAAELGLLITCLKDAGVEFGTLHSWSGKY